MEVKIEMGVGVTCVVTFQSAKCGGDETTIRENMGRRLGR